MDLRAASSLAHPGGTTSSLVSLWPSQQQQYPLQSHIQTPNTPTSFFGISRINADTRPIFSNLSQNNLVTNLSTSHNYTSYSLNSNNNASTQQFYQIRHLNNNLVSSSFQQTHPNQVFFYLFVIN